MGGAEPVEAGCKEDGGGGKRHPASPLIPPVPACGGQGSLVNVLKNLEGLVHWDLEQRRAEAGSLSQWTRDKHSPGVPSLHIILELFFFFFLWLCHMAYRILVP